MNLEELRSVQRAERQKDSLQHLRDSFYTDVAEYITQLKDERERAVSDKGPYHSDVRQLTDKIESATEVANALYERRVGKVVKHASFAAAEMAADEEGMTAEERELFEDLVARIRRNRETVLATLEGTREPASEADGPDEGVPAEGPAQSTAVAGDTDATDGSAAVDDTADDGLLADALGDSGTDTATAASPPADSPASDPSATESTDASTHSDRPTAEATAATTEADASGGTPPADRQPGSGAEVETDATDDTDTERRVPETDRTVLRITADVGTVYGVDEREYDLAREDVIDLPTTNAEPLLRKNAAERID